MSKIKNIKISDFRIYQGVEEFSFETKENEIANLITVFGPNGYGKSSFFDAIQWSLTGDVERFSNTRNGQQAVKSEGDYILTNRESAKKNKLGKVEIFNESEKILERNVQDKKSRNVDRRDDYRKGILNKSFVIKEDFTNNEAKVLSQEQVDAFIRHDSAEDKYDAVITFWDEGKRATEYLISIRERYIYTEGKLKGSVRDLGQKEKEIIAFVNEPHNLEQINILIKTLNDSPNIHFKGVLFEDNITEEKHYLVVGNVSTHQVDVKEKIENLELQATKIDDLSNSLEKYNEDQLSLERKESDLSKYKEIGGLYTEISEVEKELLVKESLSNKCLDKLNDFNTLLKNKVGYQGLTEDLVVLKKEHQTLSSNKILLLKKLEDSTTIVTTTKLSVDKQDKHVKILRDELVEIDEKHHSYNSITDDIKAIAKDITKPQKDLTEIGLDIINFQAKIDICNELSSKYSSDFLSEINNKELHGLLDSRINLLKNNTALASSLIAKEKLYKKTGDLNENLNRIIKWGAEYVQEKSESSCPLCDSPFDSLDVLLGEIKKDKGDILDQTEQEKDIEEVKNEVQNLEEEITKIETEITKIIETLKGEFESNLTTAKEKKYSLNGIIETFSNRDKINEEKLTALDFFFNERLKNDSLIDSDSIKEYKESQNDLLNEIEAGLSQMRKAITTSSTDSIKLKGELATIPALIDINETNDNLIISNELYLDTQQLLKKYTSENLYGEKVNLTEMITLQNSSKDTISDDSKELKNKKDDIENKLKDNKYYVPKPN
jgi:exonuclease SbcC